MMPVTEPVSERTPDFGGFLDLFIDDHQPAGPDDFHSCIVKNSVMLMFFGGCTMSYISLTLVANNGLGLICAIVLTTLPYLYVTFLFLKIAQRAALRNDHHGGGGRISDTVYNRSLFGGLSSLEEWTNHNISVEKIDVGKTMFSLPSEQYISNDELHECSQDQLQKMLERRSQKPSSQPSSSRQRYYEDSEHDEEDNSCKEQVIKQVKRFRQYNEACCICLDDYNAGEWIKVIPTCHHEFHVRCLEKWIATFNTYKEKHSVRAKPTCPLCNIHFCSPCFVDQARVD